MVEEIDVTRRVQFCMAIDKVIGAHDYLKLAKANLQNAERHFIKSDSMGEAHLASELAAQLELMIEERFIAVERESFSIGSAID